MNTRTRMRQYRKEVLRLRAARYRLALQHDLADLLIAPSSASRSPRKTWWLEMASVVLTIVPSRWSRALGVGLAAWRLGKRMFAKRAQAAR